MEQRKWMLINQMSRQMYMYLDVKSTFIILKWFVISVILAHCPALVSHEMYTE